MHSSALADFDTCVQQVHRICRPWQLESQHRRSFRGRVLNYTVAALNITELALGRSRMQAQPAASAAGGSRYYSLLLQIRGHGRVHAGSGDCPLREGDLVLVDSTSTAAIDSCDATLQYALNFFQPEDVLRLDAVRSLAGRPLACNAGAAALLRDSLSSVVRHACGLGALDLRAHAVDLLLAAYQEMQHGARSPVGRTLPDVQAVVRHIDAHLESPDLCPRQLALALRVSLRALYRITASAGVTPAGLIWNRRLHRAQQRLVCGDAQSITVIAHQSGFKDSGHFSRAFRQQFGHSPSALRKDARRGQRKAVLGP